MYVSPQLSWFNLACKFVFYRSGHNAKGICKCVFYRPEDNAKGGSHELHLDGLAMLKRNVPMD